MKRPKSTPATPDHAAPVSACSPEGLTADGTHRSVADRVLPVTPRRQGSRVVFAGDRLGWLTKESLVVLEPQKPDRPELAVPLGQGRGVGVVGEALLAIGQEATEVVCRVSPQGEVERWPAVLAITPYGVVRLFPDAAAGLWVVGAQALQPVALRLRGRSLETGTPLRLGAGATQKEQLEVAQLADGTFLHAHNGELTRTSPDGTSAQVDLPKELGAVQLIAAGGEERLWVGLERGALALLSLKPAPRVRACIALQPGESRPHALAASGSHAAAVVVQPGPSGQPPSWQVAAYTENGQEKLRVPLPWQPALWEEPDVSVALSASGALLAAASAEQLVVWDLASGRVLAKRSHGS